MAQHLKVLKSLEGKRARKNDAPDKRPEYAVITADVGTGEEVPLLVEAATWLPWLCKRLGSERGADWRCQWLKRETGP